MEKKEHHIIAGSYIYSTIRLEEMVKDGWEIEKSNTSISLLGGILKIHMVKEIPTEDKPKTRRIPAKTNNKTVTQDNKPE